MSEIASLLIPAGRNPLQGQGDNPVLDALIGAAIQKGQEPSFFSREAGQDRRAWLEDSINYFTPPELRPSFTLANEFNPVTSMERAAGASQTMFAPETTGIGRVGAAGEMLSNMAGVVAPAMVAGRAGMPAINALEESMLGWSAMPRAAGAEFMADEFGGVPLYGGGMSDPTQTGWTFRDMRRPVLEDGDEKRIQSAFDRVQWQETELPIGRMIATQPTVNADFAETLSSQDLLPTVVQKGNELFVRDGHHRLVKAAEAGNTRAKVALINLDPRTEAPLLEYREPAPFGADDEALLAELFGLGGQQ